MEESSDDPLAFQAKVTLLYSKRSQLLEKRPSNPFDISAGEVQNEENESSELNEPSSDPTLLKGREHSLAKVEKRVFGKGTVPTFPAGAYTKGTGEEEQIQIDCGDIEEPAETLQPSGENEEQDNADLTFVTDEERVYEEDGTIHYVEGDEMVLDEEIYYDGPWTNGEEDTLENEPDDQHGYNVDTGRSFPTDPLEEEDETLQTVHLSDGEFEPHTSDDEIAFELKGPEEQEEICEEIEELSRKMPDLAKDYRLVDRLGTGTFSSVYKAVDLNYSDWDNRLWQVSHPRSTSTAYPYPRYKESDPTYTSEISEKKPAYVAIKRILVTSSPRRIMNEILIMETCRGCRHVAQIITVHRVEDQIVVVMPYQRSAELKDLIRDLSIRGIRQYFRCLFRALRDIHTRGIIHRDLKPGNFLFDPITWTGTMVDFGLAETFEISEEKEKDSGCLHTAPTADALHGLPKEGSKYRNVLRKTLKLAKEKSDTQPENVGWPTDDTRPPVKANRAGTRGFRAPEVLLKCTVQTPAIDIWSAGTILLFFLSGKWPIFSATTDMHALLEQALIIGREAMEQCAALHGRTFSTNIPEVQHPTPWTTLVKTLNPGLFDPSCLPSPPQTQEDSEMEEMKKLVEDALDLLEKCLEPISVRRCTARDALYHPFLAPDAHEEERARQAVASSEGEQGLIVLDEDECFPHPAGEGRCQMHHMQDPETGDWKVFIGIDEHGKQEWHTIEAGEGQAIGSRPCEFHRDFEYPDHHHA